MYEYHWVETQRLNEFGKKGWRVVPGMIYPAGRASTTRILMERKVFDNDLIPQPGEPTMNLLVDAYTGKDTETLSHLPTPGE